MFSGFCLTNRLKDLVYKTRVSFINNKTQEEGYLAMASHLEKFYAVTLSGSVYRARIQFGTEPGEQGTVGLLKIAKKGQLLQEEQENTNAMLAIAKSLILFIPEGGGITSFQREVGMVNTFWWGYETNGIVALFLEDIDKALACSRKEDLVLCDPRWKENTVAVLKAVGREHPHCSISATMPELWLLPPSEW